MLEPALAAAVGFDFGDHFALALLGFGVALFVAIGALSHQGERAFSASIFYLLLGLFAAGVLSVLEVNPIDPIAEPALLERVAELALVVAVFATGLRLESGFRWRTWRSVAILIGLVMPLSIAAVALFGALVMGLSVGGAIILGAVLAPTDPVLAGDVGVGSPGEVELHGEPRFSLSGKAALNDGLASPFVLLGILVAEGDVADRLGGFLAADSLYGLTELAGAYGLVAMFAAGVAFRRYEFGHELNRHVHEGAEVVEKFGELAVILLLGSVVTVSGLGAPGAAGWLLAPVLLLVIRPGLVAALLLGSGLSIRDRAFLAWFGVRGVAALYYVSLVVAAGVLDGVEEATVFWTTVVCVMVSILVHGVTATSISRRLLGRA